MARYKMSMLSKDKIFEIADRLSSGGDLFVVEILVSASNDIEVVVDSMERVCLNQCATLSKAIQAELDEICEDYSMVVGSAGIGSNLKDERQIVKAVGKPVSVITKDGRKFVGDLISFDQGQIEVEFLSKVAVEGKKKKEEILVIEKMAIDEVKSIVEELKIK